MSLGLPRLSRARSCGSRVGGGQVEGRVGGTPGEQAGGCQGQVEARPEKWADVGGVGGG